MGNYQKAGAAQEVIFAAEVTIGRAPPGFYTPEWAKRVPTSSPSGSNITIGPAPPGFYTPSSPPPTPLSEANTETLSALAKSSTPLSPVARMELERRAQFQPASPPTEALARYEAELEEAKRRYAAGEMAREAYEKKYEEYKKFYEQEYLPALRKYNEWIAAQRERDILNISGEVGRYAPNLRESVEQNLRYLYTQLDAGKIAPQDFEKSVNEYLQMIEPAYVQARAAETGKFVTLVTPPEASQKLEPFFTSGYARYEREVLGLPEPLWEQYVKGTGDVFGAGVVYGVESLARPLAEFIAQKPLPTTTVSMVDRSVSASPLFTAGRVAWGVAEGVAIGAGIGAAAGAAAGAVAGTTHTTAVAVGKAVAVGALSAYTGVSIGYKYGTLVHTGRPLGEIVNEAIVDAAAATGSAVGFYATFNPAKEAVSSWRANRAAANFEKTFGSKMRLVTLDREWKLTEAQFQRIQVPRGETGMEEVITGYAKWTGKKIPWQEWGMVDATQARYLDVEGTLQTRVIGTRESLTKITAYNPPRTIYRIEDLTTPVKLEFPDVEKVAARELTRLVGTYTVEPGTVTMRFAVARKAAFIDFSKWNPWAPSPPSPSPSPPPSPRSPGAPKAIMPKWAEPEAGPKAFSAGGGSGQQLVLLQKEAETAVKSVAVTVARAQPKTVVVVAPAVSAAPELQRKTEVKATAVLPAAPFAAPVVRLQSKQSEITKQVQRIGVSASSAVMLAQRSAVAPAIAAGAGVAAAVAAQEAARSAQMLRGLPSSFLVAAASEGGGKGGGAFRIQLPRWQRYSERIWPVGSIERLFRAPRIKFTPPRIAAGRRRK